MYSDENTGQIVPLDGVLDQLGWPRVFKVADEMRIKVDRLMYGDPSLHSSTNTAVKNTEVI